MSERASKLSRRNFLLAASAGGVATAAAIVAKKSTPNAQPASRDKRATRGYQSTEHTNNYYRTAKV